MQSFSDTEWGFYEKARKKSLRDELTNAGDDYILNVDEEEYISYLKERYALHPLEIDKASEEVGQPIKTQEDMGCHHQIGSYPRHGSYRTVYEIEISYIFTGDEDLFHVRPSSFSLISYEICVDSTANRVSFAVKLYDMNVEEFKREKDKAYDWAFCNMNNINKCVGEYNAGLEGYIRQLFKNIKCELIKRIEFSSEINATENSQEPKTYCVPIMEHIKPKVSKHQSGKVCSPEPTLSLETYDKIISEISRIGESIERKPSLYAENNEEGIRDAFLMGLERLIEGTTVTGETFNRSGKTDILIRHTDGTNLFIGECKFWKGAKHLKEAINQLFKYLTWRDTKTALLVFVRDTNFSTVLSSIKEAVVSHQYYVKSNGNHGESSFSYIFRFPNDTSREVSLEVIVFNFNN